MSETVIPRPLKVLVVDDDEVFNHTLEMRLYKAGYMTQSAPDGEAALEKLEKEPFDLLVLDLIMPKMTGFDVLREMRKRNMRTHVIVLSRLNQPNDVRVAKELGAAECLPKESPSFMDDIVEYARQLSVS